MSNFKNGLVASMEELDEQVIVAADVEDGDVDQMIQETIEEGNEVKENVSQAEEAIQVIEALEAYQEMIQDSMQFGGLDRAQARAIEIGVQGLTRKFGIESADVVFSMESYDTPSSAMRSTQVSMEGVKDIIAKIRSKASDFANRAKKALMAKVGRFDKYMVLTGSEATKLLSKLDDEAALKEVKGDKYPGLVVNGELDPVAALSKANKFINDFMLGDKWMSGYNNALKELDARIEKMKFSGMSTSEVLSAIDKEVKSVVDSINKEIKDGVYEVTDNLKVNFELTTDGYIKTNLKTEKNQATAKTATVSELTTILKRVQEAAEKYKDFGLEHTDTIVSKYLNKVGYKSSNESVELTDSEKLAAKDYAKSSSWRKMKDSLGLDYKASDSQIVAFAKTVGRVVFTFGALNSLSIIFRMSGLDSIPFFRVVSMYCSIISAIGAAVGAAPFLFFISVAQFCLTVRPYVSYLKKMKFNKEGDLTNEDSVALTVSNESVEDVKETKEAETRLLNNIIETVDALYDASLGVAERTYGDALKFVRDSI